MPGLPVPMHIALHFIVPAVAAWLWFRREWRYAYGMMLATMIVDVDHLLADPIYDPCRCSIGFHPLHGLVPIGAYLLMCGFRRTRLAGLGLVIHMALDAIDCQVTGGAWFAA